MDKLPPICANCGERVDSAWAVTQPKVLVICGKGACERWASAQGLWLWTDSGRWRSTLPPPARRRAEKRRCAACRKELPPLRDCFVRDGTAYCTLTCVQHYNTTR